MRGSDGNEEETRNKKNLISDGFLNHIYILEEWILFLLASQEKHHISKELSAYCIWFRCSTEIPC